jgi:hypothetical protein
MSEQDSQSSVGSQKSQLKWAISGAIAIVAVLGVGSAVYSKAKPASGLEPIAATPTVELIAPEAPKAEVSQPEAPKADAPKPKPAPRVVAANPTPAPVAPRGPSSADIAACDQYAAAARTQPSEMVRDGVVGAAIGAGLGAATGAIADGKKAAGKGAGIGAIVGGAAGTAYGVNKRAQDDARANAAYQDCMSQRGFF